MEERAIVEEILNAMLGVDGGEILEKDSTTNQWSVKKSNFYDIDQGISELVEKIIPLLNGYEVVCKYVNETKHLSFGAVANALSTSMQKILQEYEALVIQLESQSLSAHLSLQALWYYIQHPMYAVRRVESICRNAANKKGGELINVIYAEYVKYSGDFRASDLLESLLRDSSQPFLEAVEQWIYWGTLPHQKIWGPFMVKQISNTGSGNDDRPYFNGTYEIDPVQVISFLQPWTEKILLCGTFVSIIESSKSVHERSFDRALSPSQKIQFSLDFRQYGTYVETAYNSAGASLLYLLREENHLIRRFRLFNRYFLMSESDWFTSFIELADLHLSQTIPKLSLERINSFFRVAVRLVSSDVDVLSFSDNISIECDKLDIADAADIIFRDSKENTANNSLHGYETCNLQYKEAYPLSLVFTGPVIQKYNIIFRYLALLTYGCNILNVSWQSSRRLSREFQAKMRNGDILRHKMLYILQTLSYHYKNEVIRPAYEMLEESIQNANSAEEVSTHHARFLERCILGGFVEQKLIMKCICKMVQDCVLFARYFENVAKTLAGEGSNPSSTAIRLLEDNTFKKTISSISSSFHARQTKLAAAIKTIAGGSHVIADQERYYSLAYKIEPQLF